MCVDASRALNAVPEFDHLRGAERGQATNLGAASQQRELLRVKLQQEGGGARFQPRYNYTRLL